MEEASMCSKEDRRPSGFLMLALAIFVCFVVLPNPAKAELIDADQKLGSRKSGPMEEVPRHGTPSVGAARLTNVLVPGGGGTGPAISADDGMWSV